MDKKYNLHEVIEIMNKEPKVRFKRVGDEKFIIERGSYGDIMLKLDNIVRPLPIFLYIHDLWIMEDQLS